MRMRTIIVALSIALVFSVGFAVMAAPPAVTLVETANGGIDIHFSEDVAAYSSLELGDWELTRTTHVASSAYFVTARRLHITFETEFGNRFLVTETERLDYDALAGADQSIKNSEGLPLFSFTGRAIEDHERPEIASAKKTGAKEVTVTFSEDVSTTVAVTAPSTFEAADWFIGTNQADGAAFIPADDVTAPNVWVITFTTDVTVGQTLQYDRTGAADDSVRDVSVNANPMWDQSITIADGTPPTMKTAAKVGDKVVEVTFDKDVRDFSTFEAGDWDTSGGANAVSATWTAPDKLQITFNIAVTLGNNLEYADTGDPDSIRDAAGNALAAGTIAITDETPPAINSAVKTGAREVTVTFSEDVSTAGGAPTPSTFEAADWFIGTNQADGAAFIPADDVTAPNVWVITFTRDVAVGETLSYDRDAAIDDSVQDLNDNPLPDQSVTILGAVGLVTAEKVGDKVVEVTFDKNVRDYSTFEAGDWSIGTDNAVSATWTAPDKLQITFDVAVALAATLQYADTGDPDSIRDAAGNALAAGTIAITDETPPAINSAVKTGAREVTVTFSEDVSTAGGAPTPSTFEAADWFIGTNQADGAAFIPADDVTAPNVWVITFTRDVAVGETLSYDRDAAIDDSVQDLNDNPLPDQSVTIGGVDIDKVEKTGEHSVLVTFTGAVQAYSTLELVDWSINTVIPTAGQFTGPDTMELTFPITITAWEMNLVYAYNTGASASIKDSTGFELPDLAYGTVVDPAQLSILQAVKVGSSVVEVLFNMDVVPDSRFEVGDWTIGGQAAIAGQFLADRLLRITFGFDVAVGDQLTYDQLAGVHDSIRVGTAVLGDTTVSITELQATLTVSDLTVNAGESGVATIFYSTGGAGLGGLQVGPSGAFGFDPAKVSVTSIVANPPYIVLATAIDNTTGKARFGLSLEGDADLAIRDGIVVKIYLEVDAAASGTSALALTVDLVKDAYDNAIPAANLTINDGTLTIGAAAGGAGDGDVNGDGSVDITDARWAAEYAIGIRTLTTAQIAAADVAPPPGVDITDARWIAEAAIGLRTLSVMAMKIAPTALPGTAQVAINMAGELIISGSRAELADIQGTLHFDPAVMNVIDIVGLNGFQILASSIDSAAGEVRFAAAKLSGRMVAEGALLQFVLAGDASQAVLDIDVLRDIRAREVRISLTIPMGGLEFGNAPNPVVDVNTTTFAVRGTAAALVDAIRVRIFDLSGRLVFEREEIGTTLDWHTDNMYGEFLANGVYLYKMYALINGEWIISEVKKLVILR